eukprot:evm.model.NODE_14167_length_11795_cov_55.725307.2
MRKAPACPPPPTSPAPPSPVVVCGVVPVVCGAGAGRIGSSDVISNAVGEGGWRGGWDRAVRWQTQASRMHSKDPQAFGPLEACCADPSLCERA